MDPEDLQLYHRRVAEARAVGLGMTQSQAVAFVGILEQNAEELARRVSNGIANRGEQWALAESREIIRQMTLDLKDSTKRGIATTASRVADIHARATTDLMRAGGVQVGHIVTGIGTSAAQAVSSRKQLAGSFVSIERGAIRQADQVIKGRLLSGVTGPQLGMQLRTQIIGARGLPTSLVLDRRRIGRRALQQMGVEPSPANIRLIRTQAGFVANRASLIARTEPMNAEWEAHIQGVISSPITGGIHWNLSGRHPEPDICDDLAGTDWYGIGVGNFPARSVPPRPHPRCICFHTDLILAISEWLKEKRHPGPLLQNPITVATRAGRSPSATSALGRAFVVGQQHTAHLAAEVPHWPSVALRNRLAKRLGIPDGAIVTTSVAAPPAGTLSWVHQQLKDLKGAIPLEDFIIGLTHRMTRPTGTPKGKGIGYQVLKPSHSGKGSPWRTVSLAEFKDALHRETPTRITGIQGAVKRIQLGGIPSGLNGYYGITKQRDGGFQTKQTLGLSTDTVEGLRILLAQAKRGNDPSPTSASALSTLIHELGHARSPSIRHKAGHRDPFGRFRSNLPNWLDIEEGINTWTAQKWTLSSLYGKGGRVVDPSVVPNEIWGALNRSYLVRAAIMQRLDTLGRKGALNRIWRWADDEVRLDNFVDEMREGLRLHIARNIKFKTHPKTWLAADRVATLISNPTGAFLVTKDVPEVWDFIGSIPGREFGVDEGFAKILEAMEEAIRTGKQGVWFPARTRKEITTVFDVGGQAFRLGGQATQGIHSISTPSREVISKLRDLFTKKKAGLLGTRPRMGFQFGFGTAKPFGYNIRKHGPRVDLVTAEFVEKIAQAMGFRYTFGGRPTEFMQDITDQQFLLYGYEQAVTTILPNNLGDPSRLDNIRQIVLNAFNPRALTAGGWFSQSDRTIHLPPFVTRDLFGAVKLLAAGEKLLDRQVKAISGVIHELIHASDVVFKGVGTGWDTATGLSITEGLTELTAKRITLHALFGDRLPGDAVFRAPLGALVKADPYLERFVKTVPLHDRENLFSRVYKHDVAMLQMVDHWGSPGALNRIWRKTGYLERTTQYMEEVRSAMNRQAARWGLPKDLRDTLARIVDFTQHSGNDIDKGFMQGALREQMEPLWQAWRELREGRWFPFGKDSRQGTRDELVELSEKTLEDLEFQMSVIGEGIRERLTPNW